MKPGRVVIVLAGRYAGRKALVVKNYDESTTDKPYPHALIAGIDRYPRKVTRRMSKKKIARRSKVKPFVRILNHNHVMPTRYMVDIGFNTQKAVNKDSFRDAALRRKARADVKAKLEERYKAGKNRWFFHKLRF